MTGKPESNRYTTNWYACSRCNAPICPAPSMATHYHDHLDFMVKGVCEKCGLVPVVVKWEGKERSSG